MLFLTLGRTLRAERIYVYGLGYYYDKGFVKN